MSKIRKTYTSEFKREALRLLETSGKSAAQIERDLGVGPGCLSRWKHRLSQEGDSAFPGTVESGRSRNGSGNWNVRTNSCAKSGTF